MLDKSNHNVHFSQSGIFENPITVVLSDTILMLLSVIYENKLLLVCIHKRHGQERAIETYVFDATCHIS